MGSCKVKITEVVSPCSYWVNGWHFFIMYAQMTTIFNSSGPKWSQNISAVYQTRSVPVVSWYSGPIACGSRNNSKAKFVFHTAMATQNFKWWLTYPCRDKVTIFLGVQSWTPGKLVWTVTWHPRDVYVNKCTTQGFINDHIFGTLEIQVPQWNLYILSF